MLLRSASLQRAMAYHEAGHVVAALQFGVPIIDVNIDSERPGLFRDHYRAPVIGLGVEVMTTLCMAGGQDEKLYCGTCSDQGDIIQASEILSRYFDAAQIGVQLERARDAARSLVRTDWARARIPLIAAAQLQYGALTGQEIRGLTSQAAHPP